MRKRVGWFLLAVFAAASIALPLAQTTLPCPEQCKVKNLQAEYGDDWHIYYMLFGCWGLPDSCTGVNGSTCAPSQAVTLKNVRFR